VTAVCGDKCVDVEVLTKHCNGCKLWRSKKGTPQYQCWLVDHQCEINHDTSSGSMESVGAINMFKRSIEKNECVYKDHTLMMGIHLPSMMLKMLIPIKTKGLFQSSLSVLDMSKSDWGHASEIL